MPHKQTTWNSPSPPVPPPSTPSLEIPPIDSKKPSSIHYHNEAWQEFTNLQPTLRMPQAIVHTQSTKSCWSIANFSTLFRLWMQLIEMRCLGNSGRN
ncbi:hypothetical protein O181_077868 [Austropuccinia psidii MF-1]|uniref:Uncharacterized protein n=1 Tax=Austropuccinia psidii MF-1 TaxID=1389203 RepID=A0A9Q3FHT7_9BASI|nr:hypothetical protein [Austropuccinia psidii MF-1]